MNRTIKFRAWDKKIKHMFTWSFPEMIDEHIPRTKDLEWTQFTGLHDKNGKEIYEGDIVTYSIQGDKQDSPLEVDMWNLHIEMAHDDSYYRIDDDSVEIIGNIYENPELL